MVHFDLGFERTLGDRFEFYFQMNVINEFLDFSLFYIVLVILIVKWAILILIFIKKLDKIYRLNYEYNLWYQIKVTVLGG